VENRANWPRSKVGVGSRDEATDPLQELMPLWRFPRFLPLGVGGGVYFATGGVACLDAATVAGIIANTATTSSDAIFGVFTICS
jgi:hypothetical protein